MAERGLSVDHSTVARWVLQYSPGTYQMNPPAPSPPRELLAGRRDLRCAEQRVIQEGSSPSGARMRSAVSEDGDN
jgi:hypothetical protein